jgi:uroporphyrinogen decarboxylase
MPSWDTDAKLRHHFGLSSGRQSERRLLDELGSDIYYLSARDISQNEGFHALWKKKPQMTDTQRTCAFGIRWQRCVGAAKFSVDESIGGPLADCTSVKEILGHPWPKRTDFDFDLLQGEAQEFSDRAVVGGLWTGILGDAYRLVGFQHFLLQAALDPRFMHALVDKLTDVYLELNDAYFSSLKGRMDIWFFGNDFGSQAGLLMSRPMWQEYFLQPITQLCNLAHAHGLAVMMHSCGAIEPLIDDLAAAGVDILDPIQVTAEGMSPESLADKHGKHIAFHGGIDTQQVLPFGTEDEVVETTRAVVQALGSHGRYIAAGSQILSGDIPLKNILAMYGEIARLRA